ncbi:hypothetical protein [Arenimonas sp. MALMAid1274]|uniref:hypothetical protein n=1 Tax=Arenimonas sp. MALMAid1274 TaxID=3411630 RepID=UPI003BA25D5D
MKRLILASVLVLFSLAAQASRPAADEAVFVEGARYSAVLDSQGRAWRLLPAGGRDLSLRVSGECHAGSVPPRGLWLLTQDAQGRPELVAPSATALPAGHSGRIRVVACGQPAPQGTLALPAGLVQWLQQNSGSIYVAR